MSVVLKNMRFNDSQGNGKIASLQVASRVSEFSQMYQRYRCGDHCIRRLSESCKQVPVTRVTYSVRRGDGQVKAGNMGKITLGNLGEGTSPNGNTPPHVKGVVYDSYWPRPSAVTAMGGVGASPFLIRPSWCRGRLCCGCRGSGIGN